MTTSDVAHRAVLFCKQGCPPCDATKDFVFALKPHLTENLSIMQKENHSALVAAYELSMYPTLLVVDKDGVELEKVIGGKNVREQLLNILNTIKANRES